MNWKDFFMPSFAKVLWFMAFFVLSFEALWIRLVCIEGSCQDWYFRLLFWLLSWPFALKAIMPTNSFLLVFLEIIFFIVLPFFFYYLLSCTIVAFFPIKRVIRRE